ncbi:MOSC domain-containing protein, partial [Paraburkholderia sp. SIMBA_054]|uniref:MOSC domain-containing protein n=1 Tax=Paraburkholderia sp. SIMBA_054 TaxID=3085795 RepID=UPI003979B221
APFDLSVRRETDRRTILQAGRGLIAFEGLDCDAQGDRKVHGGPEKALHHYPHDHYAVWREEIGENPRLSARGAFGENI